MHPSALPAHRESAFHAWVAIQYGCNNACTFCIVPSVRGAEVSRPLGEIVGEVQRLVDDGVTEISLLGQNVNSYGRDLTGRPIFAELLYAVDAVAGVRRVRYTSPHPKDFKEDTARAMAECAVGVRAPALPAAVGERHGAASHEARVLARVATWTRSRWRARRSPASRSRRTSSSASPARPTRSSRTRCRSSKQVRYDSAYMFQYSKRPGTAAATMDDQVAEAGRAGALRPVARDADADLARAQPELVGTDVELTIERNSSKTDAGRATGRTRTNKLVHVELETWRRGQRRTSSSQKRTRTTWSARGTAHYLTGCRSHLPARTVMSLLLP